MKRWPIAIVVAAFPCMAHASPLVESTGAVGESAGAQGVVSGPGPASTHFNPALLTEAEESALVAFAVVSEQIGVTLDGRRGGDVPLVVGGRNVVGPDLVPIPNTSVPTPWLERGCEPGTRPGACPPPGFAARPRQAKGSSGVTRTYLVIGLVRHLVRDRLSVGLYSMLPISRLTEARSFYADEREALFSNSLHPELYGDRLTAISIVAGAAFKILPSLSVGSGLSLGLANAASSSAYVRDATQYDQPLANTSVSTAVSVAPSVGVRYAPVERLRFGAVIHSPHSFTVDTTVRATLPSGTDSATTLGGVFDWTPWAVGVGAELDVIARARRRLSLTGSLRYALWSAYRDRHGESPSAYGEDMAWRNTATVALGVRHVLGRVRAFTDLVVTPSPVPNQVGRSNYVDNDKVGMVMGGDVELTLGSTKLRPGLQLFVHRLVPRHASKDDARIADELPDDAALGSTHDPVAGAAGLQTNNPGWPGFASGGWLSGGAFTLAIPL